MHVCRVWMGLPWPEQDRQEEKGELSPEKWARASPGRDLRPHLNGEGLEGGRERLGCKPWDR